jgi:hypothetical protein
MQPPLDGFLGYRRKSPTTPSASGSVSAFTDFYERACEPKKLVVLPIEHYDIYAGKWFDESARLARQWYERFLN